MVPGTVQERFEERFRNEEMTQPRLRLLKSLKNCQIREVFPFFRCPKDLFARFSL